MDILQCYYEIQDLTNDVIDSLDNLPSFNTPPTAYQLVGMLPGVFSIEKDTNGNDVLCAAKIDGWDMPISVNNGSYIAHPIPFTPVAILGPHPTVVFTLKPGKSK